MGGDHISYGTPSVLKYRKTDDDSLIEKISKLNFHSIIKKSNRVSSHLKHLTGFAPQVRSDSGWVPVDLLERSGSITACVNSIVPTDSLSLQLKDEAFEETEKNFRMQERLIKSFIRDLSLYLQHVRVSKYVRQR